MQLSNYFYKRLGAFHIIHKGGGWEGWVVEWGDQPTLYNLFIAYISKHYSPNVEILSCMCHTHDKSIFTRHSCL